jgi:uncharacterized membrane-anchored protein
VKAKQLIEENNRKRELLNSQNQKYYNDMLIYIRLQLSLSEQQSEEVLMEMLDHLLDGQSERKTAQEIFGDEPKQYADEIIENLPKERKREVIPFILGIGLNLISLILMIRGLIILIISQFKHVDITVYPFSTMIKFAALTGFITFGVWYFFRVIKQSLFNEKASEKKNMVKIGLFAALTMSGFIIISKFTPDIGSKFPFTWWASLVTGGILWIIVFVVKKLGVRNK